jgi:uncharacterized protein (DUF4415 family)
MSESIITRLTLDEIRKLKGQTDWERLKREEAAGIEPEPDEDDFDVDWSRARLVIPEAKTPVSIRLDPDVLAFFKAQGKGYQTRINAVLRAWMEAQVKRG